MGKMHFCKQCGYTCMVSMTTHILHRLVAGESPKTCVNCKTQMTELPTKVVDKYGCFSELEVFSTEWFDSREKYVEEYVSEFSEFNPELYAKELDRLKASAERHFQYEQQQLEESFKKIAEQRSHIPKCPICGSSNLRKITLTKRAVKTAAFGIAGAVDDAGKTWQCNNCNSKF